MSNVNIQEVLFDKGRKIDDLVKTEESSKKTVRDLKLENEYLLNLLQDNSEIEICEKGIYIRQMQCM